MPRLFLPLESTHSTVFMNLFPKSKSRNDEAGKYTLPRRRRYKIFIKYANPFPPVPICPWIMGECKNCSRIAFTIFSSQIFGKQARAGVGFDFLWLEPHLSFATEIIKRTTWNPLRRVERDRFKNGPNLRRHYWSKGSRRCLGRGTRERVQYLPPQFDPRWRSRE